jgi:glycogen debranching enzyme
VWPWLLGPFITAHIKVYGKGDVVRRQAAQWLAPLKDYVADVGLGQIAEIFDGTVPQYPHGCMAQAWSVAEIFRTLVEDIHGLVPMRYPSS